jgi:shikimate dehydrogenase
LTPAARAIGAVNCIARQGGRLLGENTDGKGFLQSVREVMPVEGKRAILLGAGGAARAIGVELLHAGVASLTVVNRGRSRGEELTAHLNRVAPGRATFAPWSGDYPVPATDLLVNATSVGLYPDVDARLPLRLDGLPPDTLVCDVIPNPPRTRLIREAAARGCRTLDGLGMLVNQGVIGIRLWTGREPDAGVMRRALEEIFGKDVG